MLALKNIMLGTDNPEPLVAFYTKVLGAPTMAEGGFTGWGTDGAFLTVGLHSEVHGTNPDPARCIWFFETTDVKGEFERIKGLGAEVIKEPYELGGSFWLATLADPDGNYFQLASPMSASTPA
ncbi:MAG TPA: VOC family protein [Candidatus Dormibacteraeota bacterium]|jgi:predicted enzyme related to lactoylglutathione lyase|nr:VOC family protein [Candidatus Dormibacteraeota bacterium]